MRIILILQLMGALALLGLGGYVLLRGGRRTLPFFGMAIALGTWVGFHGAYELCSVYLGTPIVPLHSMAGMAIVALGISTLHFALRSTPPLNNYLSRFTRVWMLLAVPISILPWFDLWQSDRRVNGDLVFSTIGPLFWVTSMYTTLNGVGCLALLLRGYLRRPNPVQRNILIYALVALGCGFLLIFTFSFILFVMGFRESFEVGPFAAVVWFLIFARGIVSSQLFDIRTIFHKTIMWFLASAVMLALLYSSVYIYFLFAPHVRRDETGFAIVGFVLLSIFYFRNVQPRIDAFFMPHSYDRDRVLYEFAAEVARLSGLPLDQAADRIIRAFVRLLDLKGAAVYYARPDHNHLLLKSEGMESEIDSLFHKNALRFPNQWPSLHDPARPGKSWFASLPIRCENPAWAHNSLKHTYAKTHSDLSHFLKRAAGAHIDLALPILHEKQGVALFLLGRKKNGKPFFENDLQLIRNLAATLSIGLWNSFLYEQLRNRAEAIQHENLALVNVSRNLARSVVSVKAGRDLVYISDAMHQVMERLRLAAKTEITVLLLGESGTGKELAATLIHNKSERSEGPFVAINCAAIPEMLLESELFGHEKGAFTGADRKREGRFEESNAGTLFLDEIGELTPALQAKLLRVLQEKSFCRVGGNTSIRWSGRLILATHRNLEEMIQEKAFRKDLYYRINAFPIQLPPLRERREDIIPMVDYLLPRYKRELKKGKLTVAEEARRLLINYDWPGNVRELENVLSGAAIVCKGDVITSRDLPDHLITRDASPESQIYEAGRSFSSIIREQEILLLKAALQSAKGNKTEAAQLLRLNRNTFTYKVKQYGLG